MTNSIPRRHQFTWVKSPPPGKPLTANDKKLLKLAARAAGVAVHPNWLDWESEYSWPWNPLRHGAQAAKLVDQSGITTKFYYGEYVLVMDNIGGEIKITTEDGALGASFRRAVVTASANVGRSMSFGTLESGNYRGKGYFLIKRRGGGEMITYGAVILLGALVIFALLCYDAIFRRPPLSAFCLIMAAVLMVVVVGKISGVVA